MDSSRREPAAFRLGCPLLTGLHRSVSSAVGATMPGWLEREEGGRRKASTVDEEVDGIEVEIDVEDDGPARAISPRGDFTDRPSSLSSSESEMEPPAGWSWPHRPLRSRRLCSMVSALRWPKTTWLVEPRVSVPAICPA